MQNFKKNWFKFIVGLTLCLLVRLLPLRPPNVEPILAVGMPFSREYGPIFGSLFGFLSIILYDLLTGTLGIWSLFTGGAYGLLGIGAFLYFRNRKGGVFHYAIFAVVGTLFFDAVTGLTIGPIFFGQPFIGAVLGQIPFTLWHLLGNVSLALVLSPGIYNLIIKNEKLEKLYEKVSIA